MIKIFGKAEVNGRERPRLSSSQLHFDRYLGSRRSFSTRDTDSASGELMVSFRRHIQTQAQVYSRLRCNGHGLVGIRRLRGTADGRH
jgi:hypothetical protein